MDNTARDRQLARLARAARAGGHTAPLRGRTHYLDATELRHVPAQRLVREIVWAERASAPPRWRDERREVVGAEFDRRGYPDAARTVREHWNEPDYAQVRAAEGRARAAEDDAAAAEARREQARASAAGTGPDFAEAAVVTAVAGTLVSLGDDLDPAEAEQQLEGQETQLAGTWAEASDEPGMTGEPDLDDGSIGADMTAAFTAPAATGGIEPAAPQQEPTPEAAAEQ